MEAKPILHGYWRSGASWRLRIILNLKEVEYEYKPVNLVKGEHKTDEYAKLNPALLVPTLEMGGECLTESMAIAEYLEELHGAKPLLPVDAMERMKVRRLCEVINSGTQPIQNLGVLKRVEAFGGDKAAWAKETNLKGLETFEKLVSKTAGKYCHGDEVTLADAFLIPQLYNAARFGLVEAE